MSFGETALGQTVVMAGWTGLLLGVWLVLYALFAGLGRWASLPVTGKEGPTPPVTALFWLGVALSVAALQLWHLLLPVGWGAQVLLLGAGIAGLISLDRGPRAASRVGGATPSWNHLLGASILLLPLALFIANQALGDPKHGDSGLYHFPTLRWFATYPVVPGLANLHGWLGFNQSYFLLAALLDLGPSILRAHHVVNGLLLLGLAAELLRGLAAVLDPTRRPGPPELVRLLFLLPLGSYATSVVNVSSPTPDAAVFAIGLLLFVYLTDLLFPGDGERSGGHEGGRAYVLLVLAATMVTFKLTLAVYAFAIVVTATALLVRRSRRSPERGRESGTGRALVVAVAAASVLVTPWLVRGVIQSGYPLYPSTVLGLPVEWRTPPGIPEELSNVVRSWARAPGRPTAEVLARDDWLGPVLSSRIRALGILVPLTLAGLLLGLARFLLGDRRSSSWRPWLAPFPAFVAAVAFWLHAAPALRFVEPVLWAVVVWLWVPALEWVLERARRRAGRVVTGGGLALVVLGATYWVVWTERTRPANVVPEDVRAAELRTYVTESGLEIHVPVSGSSLWDSELPGTVHPLPNLELRGETLAGGFRLVGSTEVPDLGPQAPEAR